MSPRLTAILATDLRHAIGHQGRLPWPKMRRDLLRFKAMTKHRICIVGRTTYEGLPPLPGRRLAVLSRDPAWAAAHIGDDTLLAVTSDPDSLLALYDDEPEIMVIGGAEVYRALLPRCRRLLLTVVGGEYPADTWPNRPTDGFRLIEQESFSPDEHTPAQITFETWARKAA